MSAAAVVRRAVAAGIHMKVTDDRLILSAASKPDERLLEELRASKPVIVEYLRGLALWDEEDWGALYDERAGILEFDGGLPRAEAEAKAAEEVTQLQMLARPRDD